MHSRRLVHLKGTLKELQAFPGILWVVVVSCSDSFKSSENLIAGSGLKTLGELLLSLPSIQDLRCLSPRAWVSPQHQLVPHSGIRASSFTGLAEEPEFWSEHPAYPRSPFQGVTGPAALPFSGKESDVSETALDVESRDWLCGTSSHPEPVLPQPAFQHLCACLFIGYLVSYQVQTKVRALCFIAWQFVTKWTRKTYRLGSQRCYLVAPRSPGDSQTTKETDFKNNLRKTKTEE